MISAKDRKQFAASIPDMGVGGHNIGRLLHEFASEVCPGQAIIDIGPFLGSTTAHLALGARPGVCIHAYDRWDANRAKMKRKAAAKGIDLPDDFLPLFIENMRIIGADVIPHKGTIMDATWDGPEIGLLVDDVGSSTACTMRKFSIFGPWLVVGARILFMDFYWFERRPEIQRYADQKAIADANPDALRFLRRAGQLTAVYEWRGGEIRHPAA